MATDLSDVVKQGYLRCKSRSLGLWQKRWLVLRSTSNKGPCRLEKYADESAARCIDQHKVQLLSNVAAISRLSSRRHAFKLNFQDGSNRCFACDSGWFAFFNFFMVASYRFSLFTKTIVVISLHRTGS